MAADRSTTMATRTPADVERHGDRIAPSRGVELGAPRPKRFAVKTGCGRGQCPQARTDAPNQRPVPELAGPIVDLVDVHVLDRAVPSLALSTAAEIVDMLPAEEIGRCLLSEGGDLFRGDSAASRVAVAARRLRFHPGAIRGAMPRLVLERS